MKRLVYAPYVQAFIQADDGVVDVSPYIVRGSVNRKVNQVSSAQLTLRNPVQGETSNLLFTEYRGPSGTDEPHPMFHPMDPIIILLTRIQGHPVQVFTGYVDKSPYFQLYPGLCTIEASCTLKRLLYTQWDASLPAVENFLSQYGWEPNGSGVWNPTAESKGQFTDGSIGALLFAALQVFGAWDKSTIFIESLPPAIKPLVMNLYNRIEPAVKQQEGQFESLLTQILGAGAQGNGAPGTVNGSLTGPVTVKGQSPTPTQLALIKQVMDIATGEGAPKLAIEALLEACIQENNFTNNPGGGGGSNGLLQLIPSTAAGLHISPFDVPGIVKAFMTTGYGGQGGAIPIANRDPTLPAHAIAQMVQASGAGAGDAGASTYGQWLTEADKIINAYHSSATTTGNTKGSANSSTAPSSTLTSTGAAAVKNQQGRSPGGKTGAAAQGGQSYLATIFPTGTKTTLQRTDMGVDIDVPDGTAIGAIGAGTVSLTTSSGFAGQPLLMVKLDQPIGQYSAWYISEGIQPTKTSGHVGAGEQIAVCQSHGTGIEMGWADPGTGYPVADSYYKEGMVTPDGTNYAHTIGVPVLSSGQSQPVTVSGTGFTGGGGGVTSVGTGTASLGNQPLAAAFSTMIQLPSIFQQAEALTFTGKRSFIADQPLFPFIEQLSQASMRQFMSMPNGNFFAFFPDYFGYFGRQFYWQIFDIEVIDGRIDLSDDPLLTHVAVAGDSTTYSGSVQWSDLFMTSGIFDIFDAFSSGYIGGLRNINDPNARFDPGVGKQAALAFLQKYGARPYVEQVPAIRSPIYELFLAFQDFMRAWSAQFQTTFEFTFMPELFPGGLVAFPEHHLQVYIEEVVHSFDYEQGFTTMARISSPSGLDDQSLADISKGLARAAPGAANQPVTKPQAGSSTALRTRAGVVTTPGAHGGGGGGGIGRRPAG